MEQSDDFDECGGAPAPETRLENAAGIDDPSSPHYAGHRAGDPRCGLGLGGPCTCDDYPAAPDPEPDDYDGYIDWLRGQ